MEIVKFPHPSLSLECRPLKKVDRQIKEWISEMFQLIRDTGGVGLAANQVALPYRFFIISLPTDDVEHVYINPIIKNRLGGMTMAEEGCLSAPGIYADVLRHNKVRVEAYDNNGNQVKSVLSGLHARVFQHEFDHIDGKMFFERLNDQTLNLLETEIKNIIDTYMNKAAAGEIDENAINEELLRLENERT